MRAFYAILVTALGNLLRRPGFSTMVIAILAIGMAVAIGMFSVLRAVVLAGLPYEQAERVMIVSSVNAKRGANGLLTPAEAQALRAEPGLFSAFARYTWGGHTIIRPGERPREFTVAVVSADFFTVLKPRMALGRPLRAEDVEQEARVIVLSHEEWMRNFNGDVGAIGQRLPLAGGDAEVVGVLPPEFQYPASSVGGWEPLYERAEPASGSPVWANARFVSAIGLLPDGATAAGTLARANDALGRLRKEIGHRDEGWRVFMTSALDDLLGETRVVLWGCLAVALLVLLIACTNVGLLLQARLIERGRTHAIAMALGASRRHLYSVLLSELLLMSLAAAGLGLVLARALITAMASALREQLPRGEAIAIDPMVMGVAIAFALLSVLLAAVLGARLRAHPQDSLRGSRGTLGLKVRWLKFGPALGVAMSTVALVAATAIGLSLHALQQVDAGFQPAGVGAVQLFRDGQHDEWRRFAPAVLDAMRAEPGLSQVAFTTAAPLSVIGNFDVDIAVSGRSSPEPYQANVRRVSGGYLELLGVPLKQGRDFNDFDRKSGEFVTIINETLARQSFGSQSAIGQKLGLPVGNGPRVEFTVVGIMADIRNRGPRVAPQPELLVPFDQSPWIGITFLARSDLPANSTLDAIERAIAKVAPEEASTRRFMLADDLAERTSLTRLFTHLLIGFGVAALLLAAFGVYALTSFVERARLAEMGLRLAVGADPARLARGLIGETLSLGGVGFVLGALAAWAALYLLNSQLYGLGATPLSSYAIAALVLLIAVLLASALPALRVARIDPNRALRTE